MTENEVLLAAIDLINAIQFRDEEKAKNLVEFLNKNFVPNNNVKELNSFIPIYQMYESDKNNPVLLYVINNLNNINADELKWNIKIREVINNENDFILNFILNTLTKNNLLYYHFNALIRLSIKIDRYDLLSQIREKMRQEGE